MNPRMQTQTEPPHIVGYATFIKVWIALVVLTGLLVGLSLTHRPNLALLGLLFITPTKASLVIFYFMHLRWDKAFCTILFFIGLVLAGVKQPEQLLHQ